MPSKRDHGGRDAYLTAETDEPYFCLIARDRHAPALLELWAAMREKEGEDPDSVAEVRRVADEMRAWAQAKGKVVMSLGAVASFVGGTYGEERRPRSAASQPAPRPAFRPKVDELVVTAHGSQIGVVTKVFRDDPELPDDSDLRDKVNVQFGRGGPVTVALATLRRPTEDELARAGYA